MRSPSWTESETHVFRGISAQHSCCNSILLGEGDSGRAGDPEEVLEVHKTKKCQPATGLDNCGVKRTSGEGRRGGGNWDRNSPSSPLVSPRSSVMQKARKEVATAVVLSLVALLLAATVAPLLLFHSLFSLSSVQGPHCPVSTGSSLACPLQTLLGDLWRKLDRAKNEHLLLPRHKRQADLACECRGEGNCSLLCGISGTEGLSGQRLSRRHRRTNR